MINTDVPRNHLGFPTIEPVDFTDDELCFEAEHWRGLALKSAPGDVGYDQWNKYATELCERDVFAVIDARVQLVDGERYPRPGRLPFSSARPSLTFWDVFLKQCA